MVDIFHDVEDAEAHEKFVKWLDRNPDGFYINCKTARDMVLHRSSCFHASPLELGSLTKNRKACSSNWHKLDDWVTEQSGKLRICRDCAPTT